MDKALTNNFKLVGGSRKAGEALSLCQNRLFKDDAGFRQRVLVTFMAGESSDDVSGPAQSLKSAGVRIIAIGLGPSVVLSQLSEMAFDSSYILTAASFNAISGITGGTSALVSQGTPNFTIKRPKIFAYFLVLKELIVLIESVSSKLEYKLLTACEIGYISTFSCLEYLNFTSYYTINSCMLGFN